MTELETINAEIETLEKKYTEVKGTQTEVYSRIVGYYRNTANWNPGKSEEFDERKNFEIQR